MKQVQVYIETATLKMDKPFTYLCEDDTVERGKRVQVQFHHRTCVGFVEDSQPVFVSPEQFAEQLGYPVKMVEKVLDSEPLLTEELMEIADFMAKNTCSPKISCYQAMLPSKIKPATNKQKIQMERWIRTKEMVYTTERQRECLEDLEEEQLYHDALAKYKSVLTGLVKKGVMEIYEKEKVYREPIRQVQPNQILTDEQQRALQQLETHEGVSLLHGVTGSGKTEVYLQLAQKVVARRKQVLILVPEISLTPQMIERVQQRFSQGVAIYHSGLNPQEKYEQYRRVMKNEVKVVVGTRSSIFLPFRRLGLIVMDEEHDTSYKQDTTPCYHCRDVVLRRGKWHQCPVVLGSATPSFETYARATKGVYQLVPLHHRIHQGLARVTCVDMKKEYQAGRTILSGLLIEKLRQCLEAGNQAILLLNRRGYSAQLTCTHCGKMLMCPHCEVAMSYHASDKTMKCHTCGTVLHVPLFCPTCHQPADFMTFGYGTQRLQEEVQRFFPQARILRMDADTTRFKNSHERLFEQFREGKADILLGTQMISKGLDIGKVTLVGVINADAGLKRTDYRSVEMTFDLLVQSAGRSGRKQQGEVILQCHELGHYAIQYAVNQDYVRFFRHEMQYRHAGQYPPYTYLVSLLFMDMKLDRAYEMARKFQKKLHGDFRILGPSELLKLKDRHRIRLLLKGKKKEEMIQAIQLALSQVDLTCTLKVDVEPFSLEG